MTIRCGRCKEDKDEAEFAPSQRTNGKWCRACFRQAYREQRPALPPRPCEACGEMIADPTPRSRFCSQYCKNQFRIKQEREAWLARMAERTCEICGSSLAGRRSNTKWCSETCASKRPVTKETKRRSRLKQKYGLTLEEFDELLAQQGGGCAICGSPDPNAQHGVWHVDHCHKTGRVRGLLCGPCNTGIGQMRDDPARLRAAADYLERATLS